MDDKIPVWRWDSIRHFYERAVWRRSFAWLPHRCLLTNQRIWFEFAYRGTAMWTGPGDPVYEHQWHKSKDHLLWVLKGY